MFVNLFRYSKMEGNNLIEEITKAVREVIKREIDGLRKEIRDEYGKLRKEIRDENRKLRKEIGVLQRDVRELKNDVEKLNTLTENMMGKIFEMTARSLI